MKNILKAKLKNQYYNTVANTLNLIQSQEGKKIIWIASYPKSGNTWTRHILSELYSFDSIHSIPDIENRGKVKKIFDLVVPVRIAGKYIYFIKTHSLPFPNHKFFPKARKRITNYGFIYVYRHPLDVFISSLNYLYFLKESKNFFGNMEKSVDELKSTGEINLYTDRFIKDLTIGNNAFTEMCGGNWLNHVNKWVHFHKTNKYLSAVIRYEDMVENPFLAFKPLSSLLGIDDMSLQNAINSSSRKILESRNANRYNKKFFWKMKSENYLNYIDKKDVKNFNNKYKEFLNSIGYYE